MSRLLLSGLGGPIPTISLPDPNTSSERPTLELLLEDGVSFEKVAYTSLGYTHYEVWCVGGSGGLGGSVGGQIVFPTAHTYEVASAEQWAVHLANNVYWDSQLSPPKNFYTDFYSTIHTSGPVSMPFGYLEYVYPGSPGWTGGYQYSVTHYQYLEYYNPTHLLPVYIYKTPYMRTSVNHMSPNAIGGGGGGGGLHVVIGELEDLPDVVPVQVGQAGADAGYGQTEVNGPFEPSPYQPYSASITQRYPEPHPSFYPPAPGGDGGTSSFGDICQASGGKGGNPAMKWVGTVLVEDRAGGAGGIGGRLEAGGGGAGSNSGANGTDGSWDGSIGQGGGGGRGGNYIPGRGHSGAMYIPGSTIPPTNGGKGSFSYIDTTVYGRGQVISALVEERSTYDYITGELIETVNVPSSYIIVPGGGGGARAKRKLLYGSDAPGYSQNGLVLLRLIKLDD